MSNTPFQEAGRTTPAPGVHLTAGGPNWVFLTVCTHRRARWLAQAPVQEALHGIWKHSAKAWLVGDYLLMPDHLHLFCAPFDPKFSIERWIAFWKDRLAKTYSGTGSFQTRGFHHRVRDTEGYTQKWTYMRENPVRAGLVKQPEEWPYFGRVHDLH